jgi:hypothetical protein
MSMTRDQRQRLIAAIQRWTQPPTPYMAGQCLPRGLSGVPEGGGVDCVRFVDAVLQETYYGRWDALEPLPREAQDSAWHNPEIVSRVARLFFDRFDLYSVEIGRSFKPGDMLCVRSKPPPGAKPLTVAEKAVMTPHHCIIVAPDLWCWHAVPAVNVCRVGAGGVKACFDLIKVWRSRKGWDAPA